MPLNAEKLDAALCAAIAAARLVIAIAEAVIKR
jgi:hypothetical protein